MKLIPLMHTGKIIYIETKFELIYYRFLNVFGHSQKRFSPKSKGDCTSDYMKGNGEWKKFYQWTPAQWQVGTQRTLKVNQNFVIF